MRWKLRENGKWLIYDVEPTKPLFRGSQWGLMSFEDALLNIANRVREYAGSLETEEATKNAIIMPFIQSVLGYDVFDPDELVP